MRGTGGFARAKEPYVCLISLGICAESATLISISNFQNMIKRVEKLRNNTLRIKTKHLNEIKKKKITQMQIN